MRTFGMPHFPSKGVGSKSVLARRNRLEARKQLAQPNFGLPRRKLSAVMGINRIEEIDVRADCGRSLRSVARPVGPVSSGQFQVIRLEGSGLVRELRSARSF